MRNRLVVGQLPLKQSSLVRIQVPQPGDMGEWFNPSVSKTDGPNKLRGFESLCLRQEE